MGKYFDKFPLVDYNGNIAKNILVNVDFTDATKNDIYSSFDFILTDESSRSDLLSEVHYGSPMYDWLIYITNNMIDPYYDYYLDDSKLNSHIIKKYGSYVEAEKQILHYRNNWAPDDSTIPLLLYDSLALNVRKYYAPVVNSSNQILEYVRRKEDWVVSTNKILKLYVDDPTLFTKDERITQSSTSAQATVIKVDDDNILVQHVVGTFDVAALKTTNITSTELIAQNISDEEAPFWASVSAHEHETEENELKKYISLIKSSYLPDVEKLFNEQIKK